MSCNYRGCTVPSESAINLSTTLVHKSGQVDRGKTKKSLIHRVTIGPIDLRFDPPHLHQYYKKAVILIGCSPSSFDGCGWIRRSYSGCCDFDCAGVPVDVDGGWRQEFFAFFKQSAEQRNLERGFGRRQPVPKNDFFIRRHRIRVPAGQIPALHQLHPQRPLISRKASSCRNCTHICAAIE